MGCNSSKGTGQPGKPGDLTAPYKLGDMQLQNRFVMGPMTRCRGDPTNNNVTDIMADYYEQRAGFGLILSECAPISPLSNAFPGAGGIWTEDHCNGWKKVCDRVHKKGGKIVLQIWHCGRATVSDFIGGETPIAPSAIAVSTNHQYTKGPHPVPKEMTEEDIKEVVEQFRKGAELAKKAGFDGIQIHGANGYLVDQFLRDGTNKRTDSYGGSPLNRCKFLLEVVDAICTVYPSKAVSVRLSPTGRYNDMYDSDPLELMKVVLGELSKKNLQFVEVKRHGQVDGAAPTVEGEDQKDDQGRVKPAYQIPNFFETLRPLYSGVLMANDGFNAESAQQIIKDKHADIVSFAALSIANPDYPERIKNGWEINKNTDYTKLFEGGANGYTDYPMYAEWKAQQDKQDTETKQEEAPQEKKEEAPQEQQEEQKE